MTEETKKNVIETLQEAYDALSDIRDRAEDDGDISLKKRITLQMMRIELAISWLEEED